MDHTTGLIKEYFSLIPAKLQQFITARTWTKTVDEISKKNNLSEDQSSALSIETLLVLVGLKDMEEFQKNIEEQLSAPSHVAESIDADIMNGVFSEVLELIFDAQVAIDNTLAELTPTTPANPIINRASIPLGLPSNIDSLTPAMLQKIIAEKDQQTVEKIVDYIRKYPQTHDGKVHPAYNYLMTSMGQGFF